MIDEGLEAASQDYLDTHFGPGAGQAHSAFLEKIEPEGIREAIHRIHLMAADTSEVSVAEHYLIGTAVLYAVGDPATAAMFARTLLYLGSTPQRVLEIAHRLSAYIGPIRAATVATHLRKAIDDYEHAGLQPWLPEHRNQP